MLYGSTAISAPLLFAPHGLITRSLTRIWQVWSTGIMTAWSPPSFGPAEIEECKHVKICLTLAALQPQRCLDLLE